MKKAFKIGCLIFFVLFLSLFLYLVLTREERIAANAIIEDSIKYYRREINARMIRVGQALPKLDPYSEPKPFPEGIISWSETLQTSVEEVKRFTDSSFITNPPLRYGPWLTEILFTIEQSYHEKGSRSIYKLIEASRDVFNRKYLMIYDPIYHSQPKLTDHQTFEPGIFYGWMIYVDFQSGKPLGYARFQTNTTLSRIDNEQYGVGLEVVNIPIVSIPVVNTTDVEKKLMEDFRNEFFRKSDSTFRAFKR